MIIEGNFQSHSEERTLLKLFPKLRNFLVVFIAVVSSNIQAKSLLSDGNVEERREWNVKPTMCESVPYHVLWKRLQMDVMQNSGSVYNVKMSSNGTVIYDLKPRIKRSSSTIKRRRDDQDGDSRKEHARKSRRRSSSILRTSGRKLFKTKRSGDHHHVGGDDTSGDPNQWLNSAYESFKMFVENFRVREDQNQNRIYFEQLASRLRQNLCQFKPRRIQLSDGYFPPSVTSGRCRKLDPKVKCLPTKYSVQLLKKAENLCYPVPSPTLNTTYEEVWVMTTLKVNVGCQSVFTKRG